MFQYTVQLESGKVIIVNAPTHPSLRGAKILRVIGKKK